MGAFAALGGMLFSNCPADCVVGPIPWSAPRQKADARCVLPMERQSCRGFPWDSDSRAVCFAQPRPHRRPI